MSSTTEIGATTFTTRSDREVEITRAFDAPAALVWAACTEPEHVPNWYGPRGWSLPVCEIDLRPGGSWRYVMRGPDGSEMGLGGVFREVSPHDRLVTTESFDDYPGESLNTMTLTEEDGVTTMTTAVLYESKEMREAVIQSGMQGGAAETLDRLAELLRTLA
ncbi:MAG TPA: SRPBCC family protein [Gaiellaceae bacterium]